MITWNNRQILFKFWTEIINVKFATVWLERTRSIAGFVINVHPGSIIIVYGWIIVLEIKITRTLSLKTCKEFLRKIFKLKLGIFFVCAFHNVYTHSDALCSDHSHNRNLGNKIRTYWKSALASDRGNNDSPDRYKLNLNPGRNLNLNYVEEGKPLELSTYILHQIDGKCLAQISDGVSTLLMCHGLAKVDNFLFFLFFVNKWKTSKFGRSFLPGLRIRKLVEFTDFIKLLKRVVQYYIDIFCIFTKSVNSTYSRIPNFEI